MIDPYSFTNRATHIGLNINLDSHHINHAISKLIIELNFPKIEVEVKFILKNPKGNGNFSC